MIFILTFFLTLFSVSCSAQNAVPVAQKPSKTEEWKGNVTGGDCKTNSECGNCGASPNSAPGGLACMCLPQLNKCGFGKYEWLNKSEE